MTVPLADVKVVKIDGANVTLEIPGGDHHVFAHTVAEGIHVGDMVKVTTNHRGQIVALEPMPS